ncbi:MAG: hypothetical protein ACRYGG_20945 [Janthinobacterium lividum]
MERKIAKYEKTGRTVTFHDLVGAFDDEHDRYVELEGAVEELLVAIGHATEPITDLSDVRLKSTFHDVLMADVRAATASATTPRSDWQAFKASVTADAVYKIKRLESGLPDNMWHDMQADPAVAAAYEAIVTKFGEKAIDPRDLR